MSKEKDYEVTEYPDGQVSVKIVDVRNHFHIQQRIMSYKDLFIVKAIADAARSNGSKIVSLSIPCFFGQRSDRRFAINESFDLKIIADFINSCDFSHVRIFDPHSDVTPALVERSIVDTSLWVVRHFITGHPTLVKSRIKEKLVLVSPDAGAYKKVFKYGEVLHLPVIAANKFRDREGNVTLNILGDIEGKDCFIVDDLADGGYTFHLLATKLKELGADKVYLYVSHAYFSKGFDLLKKNIDHIFCTNSVRDIEEKGFVTQIAVV